MEFNDCELGWYHSIEIGPDEVLTQWCATPDISDLLNYNDGYDVDDLVYGVGALNWLQQGRIIGRMDSIANGLLLEVIVLKAMFKSLVGSTYWVMAEKQVKSTKLNRILEDDCDATLELDSLFETQ